MRTVITVLLLLVIQVVVAQKDYNPFLYFQMEQSFHAYSMINPASISAHENIIINVGSQLNGGPFQGTRKYYVQSASPLTFMKGKYSHGHVGINFQGDKEGPLLSRTRWNVLYSWSTRINQDWSLAFGAALGQLGYFVKATAVSFGGASNILDGHLGTWLNHKKMYFGLSANQVFEGELVPIQQSFTISRVYHFIGGRRFDISHNFGLHSAFIVLYDPIYDHQYDLTLLGTFNKTLYAGAVIRFGRSLVMVAGLEHLSIGMFTDFSASFSYSYPLGTYAPDIQIYGIDIKFGVDWVTFPKTRL